MARTKLKLGLSCWGSLATQLGPEPRGLSQTATLYWLELEPNGYGLGRIFPHKASGRLGKALFGLITCKAFGRPGLWLGSSSFRSGLPYLPYLGTLSYHLAAGSTLALRIP